jgi:hypothetical protein
MQALFTNTTGTSNIAIGGNDGNVQAALYSNTTGANNVAIGAGTLQGNTTGTNNTAVGYQAGYTNSTGNGNVFSGRGAGFSNNTATGNTFVGYFAGYSSNATSDAYNTAVGNGAGSGLTTGIGNSFFGTGITTNGCGAVITTGSKNTIIGGYDGNRGGLDIRTASNYIVLSDGDGNPRAYVQNDGQSFTINANSGSPYSVLNFTIGAAIKTQQYWEASTSRFIIQNRTAGVYLADAGTSWTSNSDERKKDIIEPITGAVAKVDTLRTVIGKYKTDAEGTRRPFLIAQDVLAAFPEAVDAQNPDDLGVAYSDMIPLLVAAIKELKAEIDQLKGK